MSFEGRPRPASMCDGRKWASLASDFCDSLDAMELLVAENAVDTTVTDRDRQEVEGQGWGVWVQPPHTDDGKREGQFGILGTSAGLELMLSTRDFRNDIAAATRRELIMKSWRYLKVCLEKGPSPLDGGADSADDGGQDYRRTLLVRQCQALRCLSALHHRESALEQISGGQSYLAGNTELVKLLLAELKRCRLDIDLTEYPQLGSIHPGSEELTVFRFSSEPWGTDENRPTLPEAPIEWAYLWGSVLVCLTRCYIAYFIDAEEFHELVQPDHVDLLARWATNAVKSGDPDELKVGLFAGWAVMQLERIYTDDPSRSLSNLHTGGTGRIVDPSVGSAPPRASTRWIRKLRHDLRRAAKRVIKEPALQGDLHHPYSFHIEPRGEKGPDRFRQDHLVVPTLPITLWLLASIDERALFDPRVRKSAESLAGAFDPAAVNRVAPGQSSTYNGTVNMNYIHEAVAELHDRAIRTQGHSRAWRRRAHIYKPRPWVDATIGSPWAPIGFGILVLLASPVVSWGYRQIGWDFDADPPPTKVFVVSRQGLDKVEAPERSNHETKSHHHHHLSSAHQGR